MRITKDNIGDIMIRTKAYTHPNGAVDSSYTTTEITILSVDDEGSVKFTTGTHGGVFIPGTFGDDDNWEVVKKADNKNNNPLDVQEGGDHYKNCKIQPVEYMHANNLGYCEGAIIKYVSRYKKKNGKEDLLKARHFIDLLIKLEYGE